MADPGKPRARRTRVRSTEELAEREKQAKELEQAIEQMAANGLAPQEISLLTGLSAERLYKKYRDLILKGGARRTNEVAEAAFKMAVGGPERNWRQADASMNKFWLERRGGPIWGPPKADEDRGPDLTRLSVPQLIELERALRPLARNPVLIDGAIESAESRSGGGGVDAPRAGDLVDGGVGERVDGSGSVPE